MSWLDWGAARAELPGADSTDVLRLDWREFLELFAEGVGQALIERVAHHDLVASRGSGEACRELAGRVFHSGPILPLRGGHL